MERMWDRLFARSADRGPFERGGRGEALTPDALEENRDEDVDYGDIRQAGDDHADVRREDVDQDDLGREDVELTSYHIRSRRFRRRLFGGLDPEEVAVFLDEVSDALDTAQRLHIETGTQVTLLEREIEALTAPGTSIRRVERKDDTAAENRLESLRLSAIQEVEALLHDARTAAQALIDEAHERAAGIVREADALKSARQGEADQLVASATATAESIVAAAREQEASLRHELDRLAEKRVRMLDDVAAMLNACQEWLATIDPRRSPEQPGGEVDRAA